MFATRIDLDEATRARTIEQLNATLAASFDLFSHAKHAHWNVKGPGFHHLHKLFDELADQLREHVDTVAERITALGGTAHGTVRRAAAASELEEFPDKLDSDLAFVQALADRYAQHATSVRSGIETAEKDGDLATADLLTEVVRDLDKALYFLEAHLQGPSR